MPFAAMVPHPPGPQTRPSAGLPAGARDEPTRGAASGSYAPTSLACVRDDPMRRKVDERATGSPEAVPAVLSSASARIAAVSGATTIARPSEKIVIPGYSGVIPAFRFARPTE